MAVEIADALKNIVDRAILEVAFTPLSSYIEDNFENIDLAYNSKNIGVVENASLQDFSLIKIDNVDQEGDVITFRVVVDAEVEIEETVRRDREVDNVQKWFVLTCVAGFDDIAGTLVIQSISVY